MAGTPRNAPRVVVFNASETQTDDAAEAEELGTPAPEGDEQAPAQPAEPAPEGGQPPAEPQQAATKEPPNKTGLVPFDRFQKVVHENQEFRERWARLDERTRQLNEARQAAQQAAEAQARAAERPDPALDPVGAQLWDITEQLKQERAAREAIEQRFNQTTQGLTQAQQEQEFANWVNYEADQYARQNPHYYDAARHAAEWRMGFWTKLGRTPEEARDIVQKESFLVAAIARERGMKFAPVIMELATMTGWQPPQPLLANGNGAARPAASAQPGQRVAQLQRGQSMQGLGRAPAGGSEANTNYKMFTPAQIAELSEAAWSRIRADPKAWADLQYAIAQSEGITEDQMGRL